MIGRTSHGFGAAIGSLYVSFLVLCLSVGVGHRVREKGTESSVQFGDYVLHHPRSLLLRRPFEHVDGLHCVSTATLIMLGFRDTRALPICVLEDEGCYASLLHSYYEELFLRLSLKARESNSRSRTTTHFQIESRSKVPMVMLQVKAAVDEVCYPRVPGLIAAGVNGPNHQSMSVSENVQKALPFMEISLSAEIESFTVSQPQGTSIGEILYDASLLRNLPGQFWVVTIVRGRSIRKRHSGVRERRRNSWRLGNEHSLGAEGTVRGPCLHSINFSLLLVLGKMKAADENCPRALISLSISIVEVFMALEDCTIQTDKSADLIRVDICMLSKTTCGQVALLRRSIQVARGWCRGSMLPHTVKSAQAVNELRLSLRHRHQTVLSSEIWSWPVKRHLDIDWIPLLLDPPRGTNNVITAYWRRQSAAQQTRCSDNVVVRSWKWSLASDVLEDNQLHRSLNTSAWDSLNGLLSCPESKIMFLVWNVVFCCALFQRHSEYLLPISAFISIAANGSNYQSANGVEHKDYSAVQEKRSQAYTSNLLQPWKAIIRHLELFSYKRILEELLVVIQDFFFWKCFWKLYCSELEFESSFGWDLRSFGVANASLMGEPFHAFYKDLILLPLYGQWEQYNKHILKRRLVTQLAVHHVPAAGIIAGETTPLSSNDYVRRWRNMLKTCSVRRILPRRYGRHIVSASFNKVLRYASEGKAHLTQRSNTLQLIFLLLHSSSCCDIKTAYLESKDSVMRRKSSNCVVASISRSIKAGLDYWSRSRIWLSLECIPLNAFLANVITQWFRPCSYSGYVVVVVTIFLPSFQDLETFRLVVSPHLPLVDRSHNFLGTASTSTL